MATASADLLNAQYESRNIQLDLLDEPEVPERETMEELELAELAANIAEVGLIKPLVVKPRGDRFEVVAGHRRLLACRLVKYTPVPCRVKVSSTVDPLAILIAENEHVERVNPIEEARFYQRVLDEMCGNDVDVLCIKLRRRREYVEDRLNLLRGHPTVVDALQAKRISIAVARELNKVTDAGRLLIYLDCAVNQGATARQVSEWRRESAMLPAIGAAPDTGDGVAGNYGAIAPTFKPECFFCQSDQFHHMMELVYLHGPCRSILERMLQRAPAVPPQETN